MTTAVGRNLPRVTVAATAEVGAAAGVAVVAVVAVAAVAAVVVAAVVVAAVVVAAVVVAVVVATDNPHQAGTFASSTFQALASAMLEPYLERMTMALNASTPRPFAFDNSYARLPQHFFVRQAPSQATEPWLIKMNEPLAAELGLDVEVLNRDGAAIFSGNLNP
jgi:hypothetical protein